MQMCVHMWCTDNTAQHDTASTRDWVINMLTTSHNRQTVTVIIMLPAVYHTHVTSAAAYDT